MTGPEIPVDDSLKPTNNLLQNIIFGDLEDRDIRNLGLKPSQVNQWSVAILNGRVPEGFSSMDEFKEHVLGIIERAKRK